MATILEISNGQPMRNNSTPTNRTKASTQNTILCIEDYPENMQLFKRLVLSRGYNFLEAENGSQGLEIAKSQDIDLILLDVNLPDADGYALARGLNENALKSGNQIPIILISANSSEVDPKKILDAGCSGYLTKPFNIDQFWNIIESLL